jgi:hypothetical protein
VPNTSAVVYLSVAGDIIRPFLPSIFEVMILAFNLRRSKWYKPFVYKHFVSAVISSNQSGDWQVRIEYAKRNSPGTAIIVDKTIAC